MALIVDVDIRVEDATGLELETFLERVVSKALAAEGLARGEVSVVVTGDDEIQALNRAYRGIDAPTDVLSFPLDEPSEAPVGEQGPPLPVHLGDVVISLQRARVQAEEYGHSLRREIGFLAVHGVLHLLGYDHETEEEQRAMRAREEAVLALLGLAIE